MLDLISSTRSNNPMTPVSPTDAYGTNPLLTSTFDPCLTKFPFLSQLKETYPNPYSASCFPSLPNCLFPSPPTDPFSVFNYKSIFPQLLNNSAPWPQPSVGSAFHHPCTKTRTNTTGHILTFDNPAPSISETQKQSTTPEEEKPTESIVLNGAAYRRRNVYKSIIRHMYRFTFTHLEEIKELLMKAGFSPEEIQKCMDDIEYWNNLEKQSGIIKKNQVTINKILTKLSVHTYVIKESLENMLKAWECGIKGRVLQRNIKIYKEVCTLYYQQAVKLINNRSKKNKS